MSEENVLRLYRFPRPDGAPGRAGQDPGTAVRKRGSGLPLLRRRALPGSDDAGGRDRCALRRVRRDVSLAGAETADLGAGNAPARLPRSSVSGVERPQVGPAARHVEEHVEAQEDVAAERAIVSPFRVETLRDSHGRGRNRAVPHRSSAAIAPGPERFVRRADSAASRTTGPAAVPALSRSAAFPGAAPRPDDRRRHRGDRGSNRRARSSGRDRESPRAPGRVELDHGLAEEHGSRDGVGAFGHFVGDLHEKRWDTSAFRSRAHRCARSGARERRPRSEVQPLREGRPKAERTVGSRRRWRCGRAVPRGARPRPPSGRAARARPRPMGRTSGRTTLPPACRPAGRKAARSSGSRLPRLLPRSRRPSRAGDRGTAGRSGARSPPGALRRWRTSEKRKPPRGVRRTDTVASPAGSQRDRGLLPVVEQVGPAPEIGARQESDRTGSEATRVTPSSSVTHAFPDWMPRARRPPGGGGRLPVVQAVPFDPGRSLRGIPSGRGRKPQSDDLRARQRLDAGASPVVVEDTAGDTKV